MKINIPFIGEIRSGDDIPEKAITQSASMGGFLDFTSKKLSGEKEVSEKLIQAFEEWVFINVSTLAEEVSSLEFELFQFNFRRGQLEMEPVEQHPLLDLLNKFNDATTKNDAIYNTQSHLELTGDSFWLLEGDEQPDNIYLLQPDKVDLQLGDFTKQSTKLIEGYTYKIMVDGKVVKRNYNPEEIIHIKVPNPANPYRGKSVVEALATTIDTDNYAQLTLLNIFKNGLITDFLLTTDKRMTEDQVNTLAKQFKAKFMSAKNSWKVPILYGGLKLERMQATGKEMQLIELEEWFRNKIMSAFKNTRATLGIDDEVNRSTAESSILNWKRSVITPKMSRIVNNLNEFLVPRYGDNLVLGFKDPVPEDRVTEIDEAQKLYEAGLISRNEGRQIVGYEEVPNGDDFKFDPLSVNFQRQVKSKIPALKNVNLSQALSRADIYKEAKQYKDLYEKSYEEAKKIVKTVKNKESEHPSFSDEQVWNYWGKQIDIVVGAEEVFEGQVKQFIDNIVEEGLANLDNKERRESGELVSDKTEEAINKFTPTLNEILILSGQLANRLIGIDDPYIPTKAVNTREELREQIKLFAASMIETDVDIMVEALAVGLEEGKSIAVIRRELKEKFQSFSTNQADRVARTEVLKASNLGAQDAFEQSGVVVAKQWLTAQDDRVDPLCNALNGKVIELQNKFFDKGDTFEAGDKKLNLGYSDTPYPPLHPSCRCTIIPIFEGETSFDTRSIEQRQQLESKIKELEDQVDKRTKEYKKLESLRKKDKKSYSNLKEYASQLEKIAGIGDEK